mmetsp:Transcript_10965/g.24948  ORF Transcript_10965/g.24948 Transcript_10965/m.24948 type:complete len:248 (+) Transcript_10965:5784-6527(+)
MALRAPSWTSPSPQLLISALSTRESSSFSAPPSLSEPRTCSASVAPWVSGPVWLLPPSPAWLRPSLALRPATKPLAAGPPLPSTLVVVLTPMASTRSRLPTGSPAPSSPSTPLLLWTTSPAAPPLLARSTTPSILATSTSLLSPWARPMEPTSSLRSWPRSPTRALAQQCLASRSSRPAPRVSPSARSATQSPIPRDPPSASLPAPWRCPPQPLPGVACWPRASAVSRPPTPPPPALTTETWTAPRS